MKQHITKEQWGEVSKEWQDKLFEIFLHNWDYGWNSNRIYMLASIGQMIEFLMNDNSNEILLTTYGRVCVDHDWWEKGCDYCVCDEHMELCDALWEAVKYKLKQS